jgi:hypothetical protein
MAPHRGATTVARPRYRRISAAGSAALVTLVAVLGATGVLPTGETEVVFANTPTPQVAADGQRSLVLSGAVMASLPRHPDQRLGARAASAELPAESGEGRRIVFDMSDQRVWLVSANEKVRRTYLVSGSLTDNLEPGSYEVYSKSEDAIGIDDSGTMKYMVRFAHGTRAAIGFHDIPVLDGERVQTVAELGTPRSHGCIRQRRVDAKALWDFAPLGTPVAVLA